MQNSESFNGVANIEGEREDGKKTSPDVLLVDSELSDFYRRRNDENARQERLDSQKTERKKEVRKTLQKLGATAVSAIAAIAIVAGAGAKESQPLPKEQYEEKIGDFLANKENPNIRYGEDGTVTVTYEQAWRDGTMDRYKLEDANGDALYESGVMSEKNGSRSATFKSEQGLDIASADATLRANFVQNNAG